MNQLPGIHRARRKLATRGTLLTIIALFLSFAPACRAGSGDEIQADGKQTAQLGNDKRAPDVPAQLRPPGETNKVHFHVYATGVQNYVWNGTAWTFVGPDAVLFDADGDTVGIHYTFGYNAAGAPIPAWESPSGSLVVGAAVTNAPSPNPNSIPLLLIRPVLTEGPGIFEPTTFIQRVNTVGGRAPATPGSSPGQQAPVPYTAEYYFYRATND